jgi:hypothetical protein
MSVICLVLASSCYMYMSVICCYMLYVCDIYTSRLSGSRDVDAWRANGLYTEDRGLCLAPMALEHDNIVGTQCCEGFR